MGSLCSLPNEGLVRALRKACMNLNMAVSVLGVSSALIGNQPKQATYCPEFEQAQSQ